jgi:hypothetical protein
MHWSGYPVKPWTHCYSDYNLGSIQYGRCGFSAILLLDALRNCSRYSREANQETQMLMFP